MQDDGSRWVEMARSQFPRHLEGLVTPRLPRQQWPLAAMRAVVTYGATS